MPSALGRVPIALSLSLVALACSEASDEGGAAPPPYQYGPAGVAGAGGTGGSGPGAAAGRTGEGAQPTNLSGAGGSGNLGSNAGAGGTPAANAGAGGNPAANVGAGGSPAAGGTGGSSTANPGSGGSSTVTNPEGASAGCAAATANPANVQILASILSIPPTYDGRTPVPLLFAFHGANRTNLNMRNDDSRTNGSVLERNYVVAYMKSQGNAWDLGTDYPRFNMALGQALSQLCIDTRAIFAMGHSSGAQFIAQMLGDNRARERRFAGVAPVSSSRFGNPAWSPVPTFLIHGLLDSNRPQDANGAIDITQYTESNQCSGGTQPFNVPSCTTFAGNNATVNPGCVRYNGCAATTQFCNHNDPNYLENGQPSNHGWPCFATQEIFDFFEELR